MNQPMKWSDFRRWISGDQLSQPWTLTIASVSVETTHPRPGVETQVPVAHFKETRQALALSPTNQAALCSLFGDDVAACIGQRVTLRAERMQVAGRERRPVRIGPAPHEPTTATNGNGNGETLTANGHTVAWKHFADNLDAIAHQNNDAWPDGTAEIWAWLRPHFKERGFKDYKHVQAADAKELTMAVDAVAIETVRRCNVAKAKAEALPF